MERGDRDFIKKLRLANRATWNKEPVDVGTVKFTPTAKD